MGDSLQISNFLGLTGGSHSVRAIGGYTPYTGEVGTGGGSDEGASFRAVERLPKAQMVNYEEHIPSQAGYKSGISTTTLIA